MWEFISGILILSHWYTCLLMLASHSFDYCSFEVQYEIRKCDPSIFVLPQNCFSYLESSMVPQYFKVVFSIFVKDVIGIMTGIALNLQVTLDRIDMLTVLTFLNHEHEIFFYLCSLFLVISVQIFHFLGLIYSYVFYYFDAIINRIVFFMFSYILLSEYRSTTGFYILILYPETLLSLFVLNNFLLIFNIFYIKDVISKQQFYLFFSNLDNFYSFSLPNYLARTF